MWTLTDMTKALNWEKRRFDFRPKTNIKDENEFRKGDMAARWLERAEQRPADQRREGMEFRRAQGHSSCAFETPLLEFDGLSSFYPLGNPSKRGAQWIARGRASCMQCRGAYRLVRPCY
jgi:hypothetical protein